MFSGEIGIFDIDKLVMEKIIKNAHIERHFIHALYYDPNYDFLVSGSEDGYVKIWNGKDGWRNINEFVVKKNRQVSVKSFVVFFDKDLIVEARGDKELRFRRISTKEVVKSIKCHRNGNKGEAIIWLEDRKELITGFTDEICIWPFNV